MASWEVVTVGFVVVVTLIGIYAIIRNYAIDSMGELRYMLKCAKERQAIIPEDNEKMLEFSKKEIEALEEQIEHHWGRRLAGRYKSVFDIIPTPVEDPSGILTRRILKGK